MSDCSGEKIQISWYVNLVFLCILKYFSAWWWRCSVQLHKILNLAYSAAIFCVVCTLVHCRLRCTEAFRESPFCHIQHWSTFVHCRLESTEASQSAIFSSHILRGCIQKPVFLKLLSGKPDLICLPSHSQFLHQWWWWGARRNDDDDEGWWWGARKINDKTWPRF